MTECWNVIKRQKDRVFKNGEKVAGRKQRLKETAERTAQIIQGIYHS